MRYKKWMASNPTTFDEDDGDAVSVIGPSNTARMAAIVKQVVYKRQLSSSKLYGYTEEMRYAEY